MTETAIEGLDDAYAQTVRAVAASVTDVYDGDWGEREWLRLVVDYESATETDEPQTSSLSFAIARLPGGPLEKVSFALSPDGEDGFERIRALMHGQKGEYWNTATLVVERDGSYDFQFDYGPPHRLGGNLNDTRYRDYLQRYVEGTGQR